MHRFSYGIAGYKKSIIRYGSLFLVCIIALLSMTILSFAQILSDEQRNTIKQELQEYKKVITSDKYDLQKKQEDFDQLNEKIDISLQKFQHYKQSTQEYSQKLEEAQEKSINLEKEIEYFDVAQVDISKKIEAISFQKKQKEKELLEILQKKNRMNIALEAYKNEAKDLFQIFQTSELNFSTANQESLLFFIFSEEYLSDGIMTRRALDSIGYKGEEIFEMLGEISKTLDSQTTKIELEKQKIEELEQGLINQKNYLNIQKESQERFLLQLQNSQEEYRNLWKQSLQELEDSAQFIFSLEESSEKIKSEIAELEKKNKSSSRFIWPVDASLGISAYFKDPEYKNRFGVEHNAIDIPVLQGTVITSPAAGYVYKVIDNGYGYSYMILLHSDNFKTVYGHISEFLVEEGQSVQQGDPIAKSGGTPGTKGAGTLTTGAHLHFEVIENQIYRNPLLFLPNL